MKSISHIAILIVILFLTVTVPVTAYAQKSGKKFTLVIDAGHGGRDPGAMGRKSREKNITLNIALALGRMINANYPDVNVIYTRKTDVKVALKERAAIANRAKADLFISIHTNASKSRKARGCETFTLGSGSSAEAMNAAMYENEAILLEDNFKETYKGFDPRSTESYIIFELIRDHDMEKSNHCAEAIQKKMVGRCKLRNRGVSNAGFLVLHQTAMPSVLVELGFISNATEEEYLRSVAGQKALTRAIFEGFESYYKQHGPSRKIAQSAPTGKQNTTTAQPEKNSGSEDKVANNTSAPVFKIQILTSDKKLATKDKRFKGLKADFYKDGRIYKYTHGSSTDYNKILSLRRKIAPKFKEAFIIAFRNGERIDTQEAIKEFKQAKKQR